MRLSTKGRYAVMAMADLARNSSTAGGERAVSLAEIATRQEISLSYLEQLFARLRRAGLVRSITHDLWEGLGREIHRYLASVSLADVIAPRGCPTARVAAALEGAAA